MRAVLLLLAAVALAPSARADDKRIPVKEAVDEIHKQRQFLMDNMIANLQVKAKTNPDLDQMLRSPKFNEEMRKWVSDTHDQIVNRIQHGAAGDQVSVEEVKTYGRAFHDELLQLRNTMDALSRRPDFQRLDREHKIAEAVKESEHERDHVVRKYQSPGDKGASVPAITNDTIAKRLAKGAATQDPPKDDNGAGTQTSGQTGGTGGVTANPNGDTPAQGPGAGTAAGGGTDVSSPGGGSSPGGDPGAAAPQGGDQAAQDAGASLALGDAGGARQALDDGAKNGTAGTDAYAMRAELAMNAGQYSSAVQEARQALQLDPKNQDALAILHSSEGRSDGAPASAGASTLGPTGASLNGGGSGGGSGGAGGGLSGGEAGGFSSGGGARAGVPSGAQLRAASGLSGEQARKAAQDAIGLGDMPAALAYVDRALAQDPGNPALLNIRATIYARQRDYAKAAADASAGLAASPRDVALLRTKTFATLRGGDYKDALAGANTLIEREPRDAYGYGLRAHAYGNLGDRDAMASDLARAAALDPRYAAPAAAAAAGTLQAPKDSDILFLFPGETDDAASSQPAPPAAGKSSGLMTGGLVAGGVLLALGLLGAALPRMKDALGRLTRRGPTVAPLDDDSSS